MQDLIEHPEDEGCYIVDRRLQSVEESVNELTDCMFSFVTKSRRQRINQRNRVERLSPLLDWKNLGIEYSKARQLALRRAYPDSFYGASGNADGVDDEFEFGMERANPNSVPASPRWRMTGIATPGDMGTLTEEVSDLLCRRTWRSIEIDWVCSRCKPSERVIIVVNLGLARKMRKKGIHCEYRLHLL